MSGAVVVMARAPQAGRCKTRLEPLLGRSGCARLQAELIDNAVGFARSSGHPVLLAHDPPDARGEMTSFAAAGVELVAQMPGGLGTRICDAVHEAFARHGGPVTVIGTDAPLLRAGHFAEVAAALATGCDACMVPACDGGYALLALAHFEPSVFELPPHAWGGPDVRALTLGALRRAGMRVGLFDAIDDLDTPDDARRLVRHPACPPAIRELLDPRVAA